MQDDPDRIARNASRRLRKALLSSLLFLTFRHSGMVRSTRPGISRFSDVQSHIVVRCFASPRNDGAQKQKRPGHNRGVLYVGERETPKERRKPSRSFLRKPENFFWNRDTRPPRSSICWAPPVQAGCDLESMSRLSLSPALPHW